MKIKILSHPKTAPFYTPPAWPPFPGGRGANFVDRGGKVWSLFGEGIMDALSGGPAA